MASAASTSRMRSVGEADMRIMPAFGRQGFVRLRWRASEAERRPVGKVAMTDVERRRRRERLGIAAPQSYLAQSLPCDESAKGYAAAIRNCREFGDGMARTG
jgi:hypothetical protein